MFGTFPLFPHQKEFPIKKELLLQKRIPPTIKDCLTKEEFPQLMMVSDSNENTEKLAKKFHKGNRCWRGKGRQICWGTSSLVGKYFWVGEFFLAGKSGKVPNIFLYRYN